MQVGVAVEDSKFAMSDLARAARNALTLPGSSNTGLTKSNANWLNFARALRPVAVLKQIPGFS